MDDYGLRVRVEVAVRGVVVVRVAGEVDMLTGDELAACLAERLAEQPDHLVVDLAGVEFLGSTGLSVLIRARGSAEAGGTKLYLAGTATRQVHQPLIVSGLLALFDTYPDVELALAELTG